MTSFIQHRIRVSPAACTKKNEAVLPPNATSAQVPAWQIIKHSSSKNHLNCHLIKITFKN